jgi:hypothetical protein
VVPAVAADVDVKVDEEGDRRSVPLLVVTEAVAPTALLLTRDVEENEEVAVVVDEVSVVLLQVEF